MTLEQVAIWAFAYYALATICYTAVVYATSSIYPAYSRDQARRTWMYMCAVWPLAFPILLWLVIETFVDKSVKK